MTEKRAVIKVFGIVQGVGFRPFIHKLVEQYSLKGWVQNSVSGVTIDVEGEEQDLVSFIRDIPGKAPALSVIESMNVDYGQVQNYDDFKIVKSSCNEEGFVLVSPDISICSDCYHELLDPDDKRYRYPFINCTNCGPRFTIIKELPYDRDKTTMTVFPMCPECDDEYHDINNRRYHAQPDCCPECGPKLSFCSRDGSVIEGDALSVAAEKLTGGSIVAIKGLGGFHLACSALDTGAVKKLRERKHRDQKPFALMCRDVDTIKKYANVSEDEKSILEGIRKPIVLLNKAEGCSIPDEIAPDTDSIGFMLPYTPLHCLLFEDKRIEVLVMTSANISDNPIIYKNNEALDSLKDIADYFLMHNREINTRCDDSVVRVVDGKEYFIRRSRGYAPFPIKTDMEFKPILACGAEQKASFSVSRGNYIFLSQHIGDLKNYETLVHYEDQIEKFKKLFKIEPQLIACDMHPDYLSTNYANQFYNMDKVYVQHHHAHMASCMVDNNLNEDVIGITWDGTGLGLDNTVWGGEILVGSFRQFERKGTFLPVLMPGGDRAVKDIYAMALSYLIGTYGDGYKKYIDRLPGTKTDKREIELIQTMIARKINSPVTTSCGRLFDGIAAILGLCSTASYEGQGAIRLETAANYNIDEKLTFDIQNSKGMYIYDWRGTIDDIIGLVKLGYSNEFISSAFHNTVVQAAVKITCLIRDDTGINKILLSGGVFQNNIVLNKLRKRLQAEGFNTYIHRRISANDEGISVGQLAVAQNGGGVYVPCGTDENNFNR